MCWYRHFTIIARDLFPLKQVESFILLQYRSVVISPTHKKNYKTFLNNHKNGQSNLIFSYTHSSLCKLHLKHVYYTASTNSFFAYKKFKHVNKLRTKTYLQLKTQDTKKRASIMLWFFLLQTKQWNWMCKCWLINHSYEVLMKLSSHALTIKMGAVDKIFSIFPLQVV